MLVKFSCGCVGLADTQGDAVVLKPCDLPIEAAHEPITLYRRDLSDKTYEPLAPERAGELLTEISRLISDGYRYREVKRLLR